MSAQVESPPPTRPVKAPPLHPAPLVEVLRRYQQLGTVPFSCPGHKLGTGVHPELVGMLGAELFAADVWLDTASHDRALRAAEALAAATWGADRSFFLGNGSSSGNHAFLLAAVRPGEEVIVARDLHKSLLAALILTGARPVYVAPRLHPELGVGVGVDPGDLAALPAICAAAHARGVPVYVDEAWGPHLPSPPDLPCSAMAARADGAGT